METKPKHWWASRTLQVNVLVTISGLLTAITQDVSIDPKIVGYAVTLLGIVNIILRAITKKPVGK